MFQKMIQLLRLKFYTPRNNFQETERKISSLLLSCSRKSAAEIFQDLKSSPNGLDEMEAEERLKEYGLNEIAHEKPPSWYALLFKNFENPFVVLMIILGCPYAPVILR